MAVQDLAILCREEGERLINFSTDYVFGGGKNTPYREEDTPEPIQVYGISRLAGEYAALAAAPQHAVIIRTCGLYGTSGAQSKGGNFVDKRIHEAHNCASFEMSCEQIVSPTYTDDLSRALLDIIDHQEFKPGIYHLVNEGECSWYEFTIAIFEIMGINIKVKPVDRGGMSGEMRRPVYSALANTKARALGIILPQWRDGLERYLKEKYYS
jgi:dTDP-4-dehydrorhamnose reductase